MMVGRKSLTAWLKQLVLPVRNRLNWSCWRRGRFCPEERSCICSPFSDGCILFWPQYVAWHGCMFSSDSTTTNLPPRWAIKTSPTCSVSERRFDNASSSFCTCGKFQAWNSGIPGLAGDRNNTNLSMRPYPSNNKVLDGMEKRTKMNRRLFPGLLMTNKWGLYSQHNMICIRWYHLLALPFTFTCRTCAGFWSRSSWWSWSLSRKDTQRPNPTRHLNFWNRSQNPRSSFRSMEIFIFPCFLLCVSSSLEGIHGEKMTADLISLISPLLQQVPTLVDQRL